MSPEQSARGTHLLLQCAKHPHVTQQRVTFSFGYLSFFGYIASHLLNQVTAEDIVKALDAFQKLFNIHGEKGQLGPKTLRAMLTPRCGCPDLPDRTNGEHDGYRRMMAFLREEGSEACWKKRALNYYIKGWVHAHDVSHTAQRAVYSSAWKDWEEISTLSFTEVKKAKDADLIIDSGEGERDNFDGPGGTLAWSYMPDGEDKQLWMKFDLTENWTVRSDNPGTLLRNVASHEFGHMLGLEHQNTLGALMAPYYNARVERPQPPDVRCLHQLYGAPKKAMPELDETFVLRCTRLEIDGYALVKQ